MAFVKYVLRISDGAPWFPGTLSGRLPHLLVKPAPAPTCSLYFRRSVRLHININSRIRFCTCDSVTERRSVVQPWVIVVLLYLCSYQRDGSERNQARASTDTNADLLSSAFTPLFKSNLTNSDSGWSICIYSTSLNETSHRAPPK